MNIDELKEYLLSKKCKLNGCTKKEILKIETFYKIKLPRAYIRFLELMGKGAGEYMKGSSAFYNEIFDLMEDSILLLKENDIPAMPENSFVFFMHQGYQFAFFVTSMGDDPPIYYYSEGQGLRNFVQTENSFTDFLNSQLIMSGL